MQYTAQQGKSAPQKTIEHFLHLYAKEYASIGISKAKFSGKYSISPSVFYKWIAQNPHIKILTFQQQNRDRINATRIKLYEKLKEEYTELTERLQVVHHRMQMVGEEWD